jgi:hypothetical protein
MKILLLVESFVFRPSNQCILVRVIPSCFRFAKVRLYQLSLLSRCSPRYLISSSWGSCTLFIWTRGNVWTRTNLKRWHFLSWSTNGPLLVEPEVWLWCSKESITSLSLSLSLSLARLFHIISAHAVSLRLGVLLSSFSVRCWIKNVIFYEYCKIW